MHISTAGLNNDSGKYSTDEFCYLLALCYLQNHESTFFHLFIKLSRPRLAAATRYNETYSDIFVRLGEQFMLGLNRLHQAYGTCIMGTFSLLTSSHDMS
jgi:hypothetical protein